jgi:hypothetical protein
MKKPLFIAFYAIVLLFFSAWMNTLPEDGRPSIYKGRDAHALPGIISSFFPIASLASPLIAVLNRSTAYPGDCISVYITRAHGQDQFAVSAPFYKKPLTFFPYKDGYVGLIPIYAWLDAGGYQVEVSDLHANTVTVLSVSILPRTFDVQYLTVPASTAAIITDENIEKDQAFFDAARSRPIPEKLWDGAFIQPAEGQITTPYNSTRYTNDNPVPRRHLAIDIGNGEGTPVVASNNGKIVLARRLIVSGNSVVIDHGMGIFTSSFHLNEIIVKEGQVVKKGDAIGTMGATGYSVGPHLHFAVWKEGTFINPGFLFNTDPVVFGK